MALGAGLPAALIALLLIWSTPHPMRVRLTLTVVLGLSWIGFSLAIRERVARPLQTLSNMMAALREGDYSIRARGADTASPLGLAFHEVNALADHLRAQRLDAKEATALLRRVMEEIDVAIFAFDDARKLRLVNRRGEDLLEQPAERALGSPAEALGLVTALEGDTPRLVELRFPGVTGRWELRRGAYRWEGRPHELVVLADLTRALREEERVAWQRLVRVLSHEINNSLAPIQSIAASLQSRIPDGAGVEASREMAEGLSVIEARSSALGRFIHAYARLARLPKPRPLPMSVQSWVRRAASLETRLPVACVGAADATLEADGDQMETLLTNLVRNAADAALETGGSARIAWEAADGWLTVRVEDDGPGLTDSGNLFVPFYTTKPGGTGIGLTLCRQIAEAHGGSLTLENRDKASGCEARLRLRLL